MARGGRRTPRDPAPVSGPGALSERTDGGPGSDSQPLRSFPAQFHGQRQALRDLQGAAPMSAGASGQAPSPPGAPPGLPPHLANGILGPTQRPQEPVNAGVGANQVFPEDHDALVRAIYQVYPHPDILRLLGPGG